MEQTVYVDLFFMINFSMDFLCLFLCAKLMSERIRVGRFILAASFGGIYASAALFLSVGGGAAALMDMVACAVLAFIAFFSRGRLRSLPALSVVYIAVSAVLGGFMTLLFNFFNRLGLSQKISGGESAEDSLSVWLLLILAVIGGAAARIWVVFFKKKGLAREAEIEVFFEGRSVRLRAMADSGNLLRDPISGKPCVVIDRKYLFGVFPAGLLSLSRSHSSSIGDIPHEYARRICFIPTKTAVGEGLLMGVRADRVSVIREKSRKDVEAVVVISELGKSACGCGALIPPELLI